MGVSIVMGLSLKWLVYNETTHENGWSLGVALWLRKRIIYRWDTHWGRILSPGLPNQLLSRWVKHHFEGHFYGGSGPENHLSSGISHVQLVNHLSWWSYDMIFPFTGWLPSLRNHSESESKHCFAALRCAMLGPKLTVSQEKPMQIMTLTLPGMIPRNQVPHVRSFEFIQTPPPSKWRVWPRFTPGPSTFSISWAGLSAPDRGSQGSQVPRFLPHSKVFQADDHFGSCGHGAPQKKPGMKEPWRMR